MSDFAKWLRRFENERSVYGFSAALADLAAQQHQALEAPPCTAGGICGQQPGGACPSCHCRRRALSALYKALQEALE